MNLSPSRPRVLMRACDGGFARRSRGQLRIDRPRMRSAYLRSTLIQTWICSCGRVLGQDDLLDRADVHAVELHRVARLAGRSTESNSMK